MIALLIILYIIIAVLVIMGYIFYKTRVKHTKVYLYSEEDGWIFMGGLFWPLFGALLYMTDYLITIASALAAVRRYTLIKEEE